ncbi:hypothetical protein [Nostoc sp. ChiVER01]|uniref:hypothetical protein n=1 Tax=Nostoc sp. ChiVER01 TaxID=3075382 RepID=UPI002AD439BF|nr:hypothetical protein [Nostoc sp. ChiVER01]MDZ8221858.1 hypothetical protein [Nostoc sp. ChiVER01]
MNIYLTNSRNWLTKITSLWRPKSDTLSLRQLRKDIKDLGDRQDKTTEALERIEVQLVENTQVLNFLTQHLLNSEKY